MELGMQIDNDTRGWIMSATSGLACIAGACIICVDILIRYIPSKANFRIQDSNVFLASSLSLSFGVMMFSSLYSILPSSKKYLERSGYTASAAAWILLGCFVGGFVGIQVLSRFLHHYIPSHVVDCDHTHDENSHKHSHKHSHHSSRRNSLARSEQGNNATKFRNTESTPLLSSSGNGRATEALPDRPSSGRPQLRPTDRRPSMLQVQQRVMSFVKDTKPNCDSSGPCFGYSGPCGQECSLHIAPGAPNIPRHSHITRSATGNIGHKHHHTMVDEEGSDERLHQGHSADDALSISDSDESDLEAQHHHHVPENAFMSIGLQTSIAIALHKIPEGFITYATNHANPSLGFSVFMALFIHNISEGFALALPLYLALQNRGWAMFWASLLGGVSQPLGAGIAAAWFKIAGHEGRTPGSAVYGCMFAITAGIMASVALQLFAESLTLNHNRNLCIAFGFVGMAIMGMSNALTA